jgi:hypothetical protein
MFSHFCATGTRRCLLPAIIAVFAIGIAATPASSQQPFCVRFGPNDNGLPPANVVPTDLFLAMEQGSIQARMIVRSQYQAKLILTNASPDPQTIQIPNVLAARPILAQQQNSFFGPQSGNSGNGSAAANAPQSVGGSPQGSSNRSSSHNGFPSIFNGSGLNNVFNIAPEQVRTIEIKCLCLEYGKPNPRSAVKYELVPLTEVNDDPKLAEVLTSYGRGEADRDVAQAAAWHIANEMNWEKLAGLSQKIAINAEKPVFSSHQLRAAKQLVDTAKPQTAVHAAKPAIKMPKL